jgi:hypothetical protein
MTANEDTRVDLDAIIEKYRGNWTACLTASQAMNMALNDLDAVIAELRSRASIGPDSERIRELIADSIHVCERIPCSNNWAGDHCVRRNEAVSAARRAEPALRAAGLLPGPDDIVVSREALRTVLSEQQLHPYGDEADCPECAARAILRAALSQPHPAQEQTP